MYNTLNVLRSKKRKCLWTDASSLGLGAVQFQHRKNDMWSAVIRKEGISKYM